MMSRRILVVFSLVLALFSWSSNGRVLLQVQGCSTSPGKIPEECDKGFFGGTQWDNDEIECKIEDAQLECEFDEDTFGTDDVECELEIPGIGNDVDFECEVDADCQIDCSGAGLDGKIPTKYLARVEKVLAAWKPSD